MKTISKWIFVAVILFFVSGVFAGIFIQRRYLDVPPEPGPPGNQKVMRQRLLNTMTRDLSLTGEQREKIAAIMERHEDEMEEVRNEIHRKFDSLHEQIDKEISGVLTEEQIEIYRKKIQERAGKFGDRKRGDRRKDHDSRKMWDGRKMKDGGSKRDGGGTRGGMIDDGGTTEEAVAE